MTAQRKRNWEKLFITPILDAKVRTWRVPEFGYTPVVLQGLPGCHTPVSNGALGVRRWPFAVREKCEEADSQANVPMDFIPTANTLISLVQRYRRDTSDAGM